MLRRPSKPQLSTCVAFSLIACIGALPLSADDPCAIRNGYVLFAHPNLMVGINGNAREFHVILAEVVGHTPPDSLGTRFPLSHIIHPSWARSKLCRLLEVEKCGIDFTADPARVI